MGLMEYEGLEMDEEKYPEKPKKKIVSIEKVSNGYIICNGDPYSMHARKAVSKTEAEARKLANKFLSK